MARLLRGLIKRHRALFRWSIAPGPKHSELVRVRLVQVHFDVKRWIVWAQSVAHGTKGLYLDCELVMCVRGKGCDPRLLDPLPRHFTIIFPINSSV